MNTSRQFISRASVWQIVNKLLHNAIFVNTNEKEASHLSHL
jgi:hypothetical protein